MRYIKLVILSAFLLSSVYSIGQSFLDSNDGELYRNMNGLEALDSLIIERENGQKIRLLWPYYKNIKKMNDWELLLEDFQSDFRKIKNDLPVYDFCNVNYKQKKNLVVNQVRGRETYSVNEADGMDYVKSNLARLKGGRIVLLIEFNEYEELLSSTLKNEITAALSKVKHRFYFSTLSPERHYYSTSEDKLLPRPAKERRFFVPFGTRLGIVKDKPYIELRPGLGVMFDKRSFVSLNFNVLTTYNQERRKTDYDGYLSLVFGSVGPGVGTEVGFRVMKGSNIFDELYFRAGVNYTTNSNIVLGLEYFITPSESSDSSSSYIFGFKVGYGF